MAATALLSGCGQGTTSPAPASTTAPATSSAAAATGQHGTGSGGGMTITLNVPGSSVLTLGGDAVAFDFTLTNPVAAASAQTVGVVASMGHCSCAPGGAKLSPKGSMELFDPSGNTWKPVTFVREGTGMDYLTQPVVPSLTLAPGQTAAYRMQVRLAPDPQVAYTAGTSVITVTLELPGTLTSLGSATVPVTVQP